VRRGEREARVLTFLEEQCSVTHDERVDEDSKLVEELMA